jgi:hypothetical protein
MESLPSLLAQMGTVGREMASLRKPDTMPIWTITRKKLRVNARRVNASDTSCASHIDPANQAIMFVWVVRLNSCLTKRTDNRWKEQSRLQRAKNFQNLFALFGQIVRGMNARHLRF